MHAIVNMRIESSASVTIGDVIKCPEISYHTISIDVIYKGLIENNLSLNTNSNGFVMIGRCLDYCKVALIENIDLVVPSSNNLKPGWKRQN